MKFFHEPIQRSLGRLPYAYVDGVLHKDYVATGEGELRVTLPFNYRLPPHYSNRNPHRGVDYHYRSGDFTEEVYACWDAEVRYVDYRANSTGCGKQIELVHRVPFPVETESMWGTKIIHAPHAPFRTRMCHFEKIFIASGDTVKSGDVIGMVGDTGTVGVGYHLHFEVQIYYQGVWHPFNPIPFFEESKRYQEQFIADADEDTTRNNPRITTKEIQTLVTAFPDGMEVVIRGKITVGNYVGSPKVYVDIHEVEKIETL